jgi:hypothetical protein
MSISNERLMAYVDGELDSAARAEVEAAMSGDTEVERRIAKYRELRDKLKAAYEPELAEPVPERLLGMLRADSAAGADPVPHRADGDRVIDLELARTALQGARRPRPVGRRWRYPASLAASVVVAVCVAMFAWQHAQSVLIQNRGGSLVASGVLARDLSDRLAGDSGADGVRIGVSFLARNGEYCRTFSVTGENASAGLACRTPRRWEIRSLTQGNELEASGSQGDYRTAGSSLPPSILAAVQAQIAGDPLDRDGEIRARQGGWKAR